MSSTFAVDRKDLRSARWLLQADDVRASGLASLDGRVPADVGWTLEA